MLQKRNLPRLAKIVIINNKHAQIERFFSNFLRFIGVEIT